MHKKLSDNKEYAKRLYRSRSSTVEPVLGTLINFLNMKRVNTRGIDLATKHVLMATLAYNLKKYLKFANKKYAANLCSSARKQAMDDNYTPAFLFFIYFMLKNSELQKNA